MTGLENLLVNYRDRIEGKRIGIVTNPTGVDRNGIPNWERIEKIDGADVVALFSPEHGLFGEGAEGEIIIYGEGGEERKVAGVERVHSLYGNRRKPSPRMLEDLDLMIYDIQDLGVRTYTYISTLGLVLEAAGESDIPVMVLDRPAPLTGRRISGPVLKNGYQSFVGPYPIPLLYSLTPGELATMIVHEGWIKSKPKLEVIPLIYWSRDSWYDDNDLPWISPSPNIPDLTTALVYPGFVFLEATNVSEGRGTDRPFRRLGAPWIDGVLLAGVLNDRGIPGVTFEPVTFTPRHIPGKAAHPKYEGVRCRGVELEIVARNRFEPVKTGIEVLFTLISLYPDSLTMDPRAFDRLAGTDTMRRMLEQKKAPETIWKAIQKGMNDFRALARRYYLY